MKNALACLGALAVGACAAPATQLTILPPEAGYEVGGVAQLISSSERLYNSPGEQVLIGSRRNSRVLPRPDVSRILTELDASMPPPPETFIVTLSPSGKLDTRREVSFMGETVPIDSERAFADAVARAMSPTTDVLVAAQTDSVGDAKANNAFSLARAKIVASLLVAAGVAAERIQVVGRGEDEAKIQLGDEVADDLYRSAVNITVR